MFNLPFQIKAQLVFIQVPINSSPSSAPLQDNFSTSPLFIVTLLIVNIAFIVIPTLVTVYLRYELAKYLNQLVKLIEKIIDNILDLSKSLSQKRKRSLNQQGFDRQLEKEVQDLREEMQQRIEESKGNKLCKSLRKSIILQNLDNRFREASENLEQVNTAALIDGLYSQEKCRFLGFTFRCEQIDYWCIILPNLLLAMGLLGTFLGITINLSHLNHIVNQIFNDIVSQNFNEIDTSKISEFQIALQKPLNAMALAFITSLIAISCSVILSLVNFFWNTSLAKSHLISSLEDYLDNIIQPTIFGHTRLDTAVNRMVEKQNEFLTRFHDNVTKAVESSLGNVAEQISEGNKEATELARKVYEQFTETAGTLDRGANTFKYVVEDAVPSLEKQIETLNQITPQLQTFSESFASGAIVFREASQKIEQSQFSENLERLTSDLAATQERFSQSTSLLEQYIGQIVEGNHRATELAEQVYRKWQESSGTLEESAIVFLEASEKFQQSQFADKLSTATVDLDNILSHFSQSVFHLTQSNQILHSALTSLQNQLKQQVNYLAQTQSELSQLTKAVKQSQKQSHSGLEIFGKHLVESIYSIYQQLTSNIKKFFKRSK